MYEYAVIFTTRSGKYAILVKEADCHSTAISIAIDEMKVKGIVFWAIEAHTILP
jgi:hypothetical protein